MKKQWKRVLNHETSDDCDFCEVKDYCKKKCNRMMEELIKEKVGGFISAFIVNIGLKKLKEKRF